MLFKSRRQQTQQTSCNTPTECVRPTPTECEPELHSLYERIARGHALAEVEKQAQRKWRG